MNRDYRRPLAPAPARRDLGAVTLQGLAFLLASVGIALSVSAALGCDPTAPSAASRPAILEARP